MSSANLILRRFGAAAVDIGILVVFTWGGWWAIARPVPGVYRAFGLDPCAGRAACLSSGSSYADGWPVVILVVLVVIYLVGVFVVQRGLTGSTVGSMLFMVRVVDVEGRPIGVNRALVRSVAGAVDYLPCCLPIVGVTSIVASPTHQRVGDMAAASHVVDARFDSGSSTGAAPPDPKAAVGSRPLHPGEGIPATPPTLRSESPPQSPGPLWDPSRGAYVHWDEVRGNWLIFDPSSQTWSDLQV